MILKLEDVYKYFPLSGSAEVVRAVDGVSFELSRGETLGLVGESGCGKSTLGRCIVRLYDLTAGRIEFEGKDLSRLSSRELRRTRERMQIIFQDPFASLDPRMTVGEILAEPIDNFHYARGAARKARIQELLDLVGLNPNFTNRYPHEFSGGQRQRIGIARALALNPSLIVCDEPVSALDVSIQAQIINLLQDLQRALHLTYVFIAHDLAVVRHLSDRVAVMYLGKIVEIANRREIYQSPEHPYTSALLSSIPIPDPEVERRRAVIPIQGEIPSPVNPPSGCRFHPRCPIARVPGPCDQEEPALISHFEADHVAACHFAGELRERGSEQNRVVAERG